MKCIIDLDNVVSDWAGWVFSQQIEVPKFTGLRSGKLQDMWPGMTDDEVSKIVQDIRGYADTRPLPGALDVLWTVVNEHKATLLYLSAAPKEALDARYTWLKKYTFPYMEEQGVIDVIHMGDSPSKISWLMDYGHGFDLIIDDSLSHLDAAFIVNIPIRLIYDQPWNQDDDDNHERVKSWYEVLQKIKE